MTPTAAAAVTRHNRYDEIRSSEEKGRAEPPPPAPTPAISDALWAARNVYVDKVLLSYRARFVASGSPAPLRRGEQHIDGMSRSELTDVAFTANYILTSLSHRSNTRGELWSTSPAILLSFLQEKNAFPGPTITIA
ncbi:hypothetical protein DPEC_G00292650 [Dallia pectoralis]|uniref:Uncharacterized protein n=1 Tax=Dallia pectoralis TaxID=75939 RepID=A0ACC2FHY9_DALPE|nr:hypothetical protein DPEC_G00292650 [Dallia pectoralis]